MLISVLAAVTGCSDRKPDIDYDLIGGTYEAGENEYKVQIFGDSSDTTVEAPTESETEATTSSTPETTKSTTTKPAVTVSTSKATTPAQTVRTDLPKVTAEPQYTTASTTTTKPKQTEPTEIETDENGFPANPQNGDKFTDSTGQEYMYNSIFERWVPGHSGNVNMQEFPDNYGEIGSGQQVLH
jgi:collagen-binding protein A